MNRKPGEDKAAFVDRCMGDEAMRSEYPPQDQRRAVCEEYADKPEADVREESFVEAIGFEVESVDVRTRRLKDVTVLGEHSLNGRTYTEDARRAAVSLLEDSKVYLNHRPRSPHNAPHPVQNYVGRLRGLYMDDDGRVRAKTLQVVNEDHWPLVSGLARNDPSSVGLSIDAQGEVEAGTGNVLAIRWVKSVDIVSDPAATRGLFEEREPAMDWKSITLEQLRRERKDLVESVETELMKERDELKKKLAAAEAALAEKSKQDEDKKEEPVKEERLRMALKAGVRLSEVQLKAYEGLTEEKDAKAFLEEAAKQSPVSRGKTGAAELSKDVLREAILG